MNPILSQLTKPKYYLFKVYNDDDHCLNIYLKHQFNGVEDIDEVYRVEPIDESKYIPYLSFLDRMNVQNIAYLEFLKARNMPLNRMGYMDYLRSINMDPNDWIGRLRMTGGKHLEDSASLEIVEIEGE